MTAAVASANGLDWAQTFAEFHARHRDAKGKKLMYMAVFNAAMEAFILCPAVPLPWRVLAWIWRYSWGNSSDYCVDRIGGTPLGQRACADDFKVAKQRINDCVSFLRDLYFVLPPDGHKLYPVDDPSQARSKSPDPSGLSNNSDDPKSPAPSGLSNNSDDPKSPAPSGLFKVYCEEWKVRSLADFQELQSAEGTVNRIKKVRLGGYRPWLRERTNCKPSLLSNTQSIEGPISKEEPASSSPEVIYKDPPSSSSSAVGPLEVATQLEVAPPEKSKAEEEDGGSVEWKIFQTLYPANRFDAPKSKPVFEGKTKPERMRVIERLGVYLKCARWKSEDGRWIPLASNWLKNESYKEAPPPLVEKPASGENKLGFKEGVKAEAERRLAKYGRI